MKSTLRKRLGLGALVFTLVVGPSTAYVAPAFDLRAGCERGKDWARSHSSQIPSSMAELMAFPPSMRNGIFTVMSPERKASIWKEQLVDFRDSAGLSRTQREFVARAIEHVSPTLYSDQTAPEYELKRAAAKEIVLAARSLFTAEQVRVFDKIGYGVRPTHSFASVRLKAADKARSWGAVLAGASPLPECYCSGWYDPCYPAECAGHCAVTFGCGPFGDMFCDGICE